MARHKHSYQILVASLLIAIFIAIPNYFQRGRTQLAYLDEAGNRTAVPMNIYLLNVLFPEEEVMNAGMKATAIMPPAELSPLFKNLGNRYIQDAQHDFWNGMALTFYWPYNKLSLQGSNPGTFTIAQAYNEVLGTHYDGVYITKPRHYDKEKSYPVVFFAHGYLGSWELYQGLFSDLKDCFVVSFGTRDLSGIFGYEDINKIFSIYLPMLKKEGLFADKDTTLISIDGGKISYRRVGNVLEALQQLGWDMEPVFCGGNDPWVQLREQWHSGANFFALGDGKVMGYRRNTHTVEALDKAGFAVLNAEDIVADRVSMGDYDRFVVVFPGSELPRAGGGARCMTMPILRD